MKVGFIGLGRMGQGMAGRVHGAGHALAIYDAAAAQTAALAALGARAATSVADLCQERDVIVTMLVEDATILSVATGPEGLVDSLTPGAIHLVMGTHGVATIRTLEQRHAEAGQILVAAPVLGRPDLAATGQLGIVVGGPLEATQRVRPLLEAIGRRIFEAGPKPESATAIKLANNAVLGCAM
ncbi:MAG TPA: NAD(P)-binding domain-containing protein, partial [Vicinamibacterales bacterium]